MNLLSVILFWTTLFAASIDYLVICEKKITVNGNTSLGGFNCKYNVPQQNDTLFIANMTSNPYCFAIPVASFACGNFLLNRDFQYTLKAEEYPEITVKVLSLSKQQSGLKGNIELSLVGKTKLLKDVSFVRKVDGEKTSIVASFVFYASEFQLTPPRRLGGMIKAEDAMDVAVELTLK